MRTLLLCASFAGALGVAAGATASQPGVKIGTLSCHEESGWGWVLGSARGLKCQYSGVNGRADYVGKITRVGVDLGYQGPTDMVWAVFAPSADVGTRWLDGHYGGVTGSAAVGVGLGANVMLGGSDKTIALQPLSVSGKTGLQVAGGIGGMTIVRVPGSAFPP
jgi:hypothetical protein